jgi:dienelactone hydrolase
MAVKETKTMSSIAKAILFTAVSLASSSLLLAQSATNPSAIGRKALDLLLAGKYPELGGMFSETMKRTVSLDFLQDRVAAELKEFGQPQSVGEVILGVEGTNNLVSFPVQFSNTSIHIQFTVDKSGQIAGMFFRPPNKALPFQWARPAYSKPESFHEREVTIGSDDWKVTGTLTTPASGAKVPGIVLVHGPGPNDRNESIFATRIFEDLAEGLSSRGYAVLRYDKRSKVHGEELSQMSYTLDDETVGDAVRAIAVLRSQPGIDPNRIYLLGHSLGGYASPRIAARDGKLAGIILLAGLARPVEDAAKEQTEYVTHLKGDPDPGEQARLDQLAAEVQKVKALDPKGDNPPMVLGFPTTWWLNVKGYDPATEAKKLGLPMLVLQGERDFQVTMKDFALWKSALSSRNNVSFHSYPALNDLFIAGEGKGSPAEYHSPGNVAPAVLDDIANWLSTQNK